MTEAGVRMQANAKYLFFATVLLAGLLFAGGQSVVQHRIYNLNEDDTVKTLTVSRGSEIKLSLPNHVDGGYRFEPIKYDHAILQLQGHIEDGPPAGSALGASGVGIWRFIAIKKGITPVNVTATRPWRGGGTVTVFKNKIKVE